MQSGSGNRLIAFLVIGGILLGAQVYARFMRKANEAAHPGLGLAAIAEALGLSIVRGDPAFHLVNGASESFLWRLVGVQKYDVDLLLEGTAAGRPLSLAIVERFFRWRVRGAVLREKYEHDSRLTLGIHSAARFECWLETANPHIAARPRLGLPVVHRVAVATGTLVVSAESPAAVAAVLPLLERLAGMLHYLHLVAEGGKLELVMTRMGLYTVAPQLRTLEEAMLAIAAGLEGAAAGYAALAIG